MSQISAYALIRRVSTLIHADTHIVQDTRINTSPREFAIASAVPLIHSAIARGHKIDDCFTLWDALRKMRDIQQVERVGGCELTGDQSRDGFTH
ncbi:hypothetical protein FOPG_01473 [Fusarium oxysporum f. sp. conglutinans race 2 54008]|uniref:Uncharacterized protein n=5 Tax=Fusarium oxysporum species complex TaxID=171631 RepID=X0LHW6_FUSOX|nr:uncharacterized protein FOIG_08294 [Fusarium odoratissimum NRRL 54006]EXA48069.1 hypothetical protein FOVG_04947 [Fusarium oxysporum f. sp. pisi HDV247]EXL87149.1 hypothetical protein FOPG_01473 [Fusarium oxysporum f. sp. conglutinans race 2 54008]EXM25554.1 hypothetical protein FOTG_07933 [Fusarium oxysporum f. sp. vasinfectum 25433]TXC11622.1 hypothetical protein FocTR4_00006672 [Fusarium oxysporum f. sp. cubense]EXM00327.1 hypothetical protein FOIG_08294 [Fusarium odoratissimum NRRL 5400